MTIFSGMELSLMYDILEVFLKGQIEAGSEGRTVTLTSGLPGPNG